MIVFPKEVIRKVIADVSGVHPTRVLYDGDPEPFVGPVMNAREGRALVTLSVSPRRVSAFKDPKTLIVSPGAPTRQVTSGFRDFTLQILVECFGSDASDLLEEVRMGITDEHREELKADGVTFRSFGEIINLGGEADNQATDISVLEIFCGLIVEKETVFENGGDYIERANPPVYDGEPS